MQRKVEMARALTAGPKLLLLDEPVAGMNHDEADELRRLLLNCNDAGLTILLIEHDMAFVINLATALCARFRRHDCCRRAGRIRRDPVVLDAYLGSEAAMLKCASLEVFYGPIRAVRGIDLDIGRRDRGADRRQRRRQDHDRHAPSPGLLPYRGDIGFEGRSSRPTAPNSILRAGISLVPEGRGILGRMSVEDNLLMGIYARTRPRRSAADIERMFERFPILAERRALDGSLLSGGEQQMLAIARALLSRPRLLLLDEPSLGLPEDPAISCSHDRRPARGGLTVLLVEQKARPDAQVANRAYLLETGRVIASGSAADLAAGSLHFRSIFGKGAGRRVKRSMTNEHRPMSIRSDVQ